MSLGNKLASLTFSNPRICFTILSAPKFDFYGPELINTNELLGEIPGIIGGKTGYTDTAGGCMILVTTTPKEQGFLVNVILGTDGVNGRFDEMKKLVNWVNSAYRW